MGALAVAGGILLAIFIIFVVGVVVIALLAVYAPPEFGNVEVPMTVKLEPTNN